MSEKVSQAVLFWFFLRVIVNKIRVALRNNPASHIPLVPQRTPFERFHCQITPLHFNTCATGRTQNKLEQGI